MKEITVAVARADLAALEAEAERRGLPLTAIVAEAVTEKAITIRMRPRPHVGVTRSTDGRSAAETTSEPVA